MASVKETAAEHEENDAKISKKKKRDTININITINTDVNDTEFESKNGLFRIYVTKLSDREYAYYYL